MKRLKKGIKISLWGLGIQTFGMMLDVLHHVDIGINSPEGLLSPWHALIGVGFGITMLGILKTHISHRKYSGSQVMIPDTE